MWLCRLFLTIKQKCTISRSSIHLHTHAHRYTIQGTSDGHQSSNITHVHKNNTIYLISPLLYMYNGLQRPRHVQAWFKHQIWTRRAMMKQLNPGNKERPHSNSFVPVPNPHSLRAHAHTHAHTHTHTHTIVKLRLSFVGGNKAYSLSAQRANFSSTLSSKTEVGCFHERSYQ